MKRPKTQYAKIDGLNIAFQEFGEGPVDLLYVQGWMSNVEYAWESPDYARFLGKLGRFARVIFFDKRGVGMSDRDVPVPTLEQRSRDINAILDKVGSERAAIFGVSEGGAISSVFTATFPERVSHLINFGSRPRYKWAPDYKIGLKPEEVEENIQSFIDGWGGPLEFESGAPSAAHNQAAVDWWSAYLRFSASPRTAENLTRMNYTIDYRDVLPAIRVPSLILHREGDQWCDIAHARYAASHIKGAELRILPGDEHLVWYGDQDAVISEIKSFVTGEASGTSVDRALLTLVFLDIVESTDRLANFGDERWKSILEQLDVVVKRRVSGFGGQHVKHTGDGYLLAFSGPTAAVECAKAINYELEKLGLQGRTGVHIGEAERRGDDLSGMAVHIAARIMAEADPMTIVASQTVKDLTQGSGLSFSPLGQRVLKGVPGEWMLFSVSA